MMKSNMNIEVEFLAGTKLEDAVIEAKEKACDFNLVYICFKFNGVSFSIGRNADVHAVLEEYKNGGKGYEVVHP